MDVLIDCFTEPKTLLDLAIINVCKKCKYNYNILLTGHLMEHKHIKSTIDSENVKIITFGSGYIGEGRDLSRDVSCLLRQVGLTVDIFCLSVSTLDTVNRRPLVTVNNMIVIIQFRLGYVHVTLCHICIAQLSDTVNSAAFTHGPC